MLILLVYFLLLKIDDLLSFIKMNNHIFIMSGILSVMLLLPTIAGEFLTLAAPNAFGQQGMFDSFDKDSGGSASDITNNNNNNNNNNNIITDYNIVPVSTTIGTNGTSSAPSGNMTETIPTITARDVINSTYIVPRDLDEGESERRIGRAIRDRINDVFHTVVASNATIISTATITNNFLDESTSTNNHTRLLEIIEDQVDAALAGIRAMSQPANPLLELHADIETVCIANDTSLADCDMNIRIR
jgi:hypothetical protein